MYYFQVVIFDNKLIIYHFQFSGLFQNVIAMSGAATSQWIVPPNQINLIERQARLLNCSTNSMHLMIDCLKTVSIKRQNNIYNLGFLLTAKLC